MYVPVAYNKCISMTSLQRKYQINAKFSFSLPRVTRRSCFLV